MTKITFILSSLLLLVLQSSLIAEDAPPVRDQGIWQTVIMIAIFLGFFYFILFRPEQKRRKAAEEQRSKLKKGDRVTAMGIIGTIIRVQEQTVIVKMYDGSKIEVLKGAITDVISGSEEDANKAEKEDRTDSKKIETLPTEK